MKLTPAIIKKRRAIARDVIQQLKVRAYNATRGIYIQHESSWRANGHNAIDAQDANGELQQLIKTRVNKKNPCMVCALGSAFLSAVRLYDNFTVKEGQVGNSRMRTKLREFFTDRELGFIEASFELNEKFIGRKYDLGWAGKPLPLWVVEQRAEYSRATSFQTFLERLVSADRLEFIMTAVATLAGEKITLEGLCREALKALATDDSYATQRRQFGW